MGQSVSKNDLESVRKEMASHVKLADLPDCARPGDLPTRANFVSKGNINTNLYALKSELPTNVVKKNAIPTLDPYLLKSQIPKDYLKESELPPIHEYVTKNNFKQMFNVSDKMKKADVEKQVANRSFWCGADGNICNAPMGATINIGNSSVDIGGYKIDFKGSHFKLAYYPEGVTIIDGDPWEQWKSRLSAQEKAAKEAEIARANALRAQREQSHQAWMQQKPVAFPDFETECQPSKDGNAICKARAAAAGKGNAAFWNSIWSNCASCGCSWKAGCLCGKTKFGCKYNIDQATKEWQSREPK